MESVTVVFNSSLDTFKEVVFPCFLDLRIIMNIELGY